MAHMRTRRSDTGSLRFSEMQVTSGPVIWLMAWSNCLRWVSYSTSPYKLQIPLLTPKCELYFIPDSKRCLSFLFLRTSRVHERTQKSPFPSPRPSHRAPGNTPSDSYPSRFSFPSLRLSCQCTSTPRVQWLIAAISPQRRALHMPLPPTRRTSSSYPAAGPHFWGTPCWGSSQPRPGPRRAR